MASGGDFLFTAKPFSHKPFSHLALYDFMNGAELDEASLPRKEGGKKLTFRTRWFTGAPLCKAKSLPPRRRGTR